MVRMEINAICSAIHKKHKCTLQAERRIQAMYVQRNIQARSYNHCSSRKVTSIRYSESVFVDLGIQYATVCNAHMPYCHLRPPRLYDIFPHYLTNGTILEKKVIKLNSVALVRERTIPTERPPPVGEVSANFCG